jgi:uncharacterized SAM-binding protein YcdF (DUF218 family)
MIGKRLILAFVGCIAIVLTIWITIDQSSKIRLALKPLSMGEAINGDFGDVLIVPGSGCNPGCGTEERINLAYSLYKQKPRVVIVSEGFCSKQEIKNFSVRMVHQWGFKPDHIVWENTSRNTKENIVNSLAICDSLSLKEVIVCTSPFHQLRCWILMEKMYSGQFKIAQMKPEHYEYDHYSVYRDKKAMVIKQEYFKLAYHLLLD